MQSTENQKLREALQAISDIDDTTNHSVDASAALDRIGQIARQALALPTEPAHADTWGISRAMVTLYAYECDGATDKALALALPNDDVKSVLQGALNVLGCLEYGITGVDSWPCEDSVENVVHRIRKVLEESQ